MLNTNFQIKRCAINLLTIAFIGMFGALSLFAQSNEKPAGPIKGAVIKGGQNGSVTFCWSTDENTASSYRLKVWQLMQGQNGTQAMRSNQPIVTKDVDNVSDTMTTAKHAIKTKGAGGERLATGDNPDVIKACTEAFEAQEHAIKTKGAGGDRSSTETDIAAKRHSIQTKGAGGEKVGHPSIIKGYTIEDSIACPGGSYCPYVWTVEALDEKGNPLNPNSAPEVFKFLPEVPTRPKGPKIYAQ